jgi:flagellar FliJ protein
MAFKFPLATVLRFRGILEEREERMLQKILFEIAQTSETLAQTADEIAGTDASRREDIFKSVTALHFHASYAQVAELKEKRKTLEERIEKLEELRDRQVIVYEAARRNREMLTDMREEKRDAYDSDVARREQKTLDDNYIARRGRV